MSRRDKLDPFTGKADEYMGDLCKWIQVRADQLFVCRHAFPTLSIDLILF